MLATPCGHPIQRGMHLHQFFGRKIFPNFQPVPMTSDEELRHEMLVLNAHLTNFRSYILVSYPIILWHHSEYLHTPDTDLSRYPLAPFKAPAGYLHTPDTELSRYSLAPVRVPAGYLPTPDTELSRYPLTPVRVPAYPWHWAIPLSSGTGQDTCGEPAYPWHWAIPLSRCSLVRALLQSSHFSLLALLPFAAPDVRQQIWL